MKCSDTFFCIERQNFNPQKREQVEFEVMPVQLISPLCLEMHSCRHHSETLSCIVEKGLPTCADNIPDEVRLFFVFPDELTVENNNRLKGDRVVLPKSQHSVLDSIHKGHKGVKTTKEGQEKVF